ncbi:MAG: hypothetical protein MZV70_50835 [Desulfobacterales bacterium]|nr:hypothetical protein [Desulfobacterales bacterium]
MRRNTIRPRGRSCDAGAAHASAAAAVAARQSSGRSCKSLNTGARPAGRGRFRRRPVGVRADRGRRALHLHRRRRPSPSKLPSGAQAERIAVAPDGERLYVTHRQGKRVDVGPDRLRARDQPVRRTLQGPRKGAGDRSRCSAISSERYCAGLAPVLEQVLETFPDKVRVVFKNYPLLQATSSPARPRLTAQAAHLQGKFWAVHDEFFKVQRAS